MAGILVFVSTGPTRKLDSYVVPMPPKTQNKLVSYLKLYLSYSIAQVVSSEIIKMANLLELGRDIPPIVFISHY